MSTQKKIGEMFEEVVEHLDEFEYPYCYINGNQDCPNWQCDESLPF